MCSPSRGRTSSIWSGSEAQGPRPTHPGVGFLKRTTNRAEHVQAPAPVVARRGAPGPRPTFQPFSFWVLDSRFAIGRDRERVLFAPKWAGADASRNPKSELATPKRELLPAFTPPFARRVPAGSLSAACSPPRLNRCDPGAGAHHACAGASRSFVPVSGSPSWLAGSGRSCRLPPRRPCPFPSSTGNLSPAGASLLSPPRAGAQTGSASPS